MPVGTLPTVAMTPPGVRIHQRQRVSSSEVASKDISLEIKPKSMHSLSQLATVTVTSRAGSLLSQRSVPLNYMEDPTIAQVIEGVGNKLWAEWKERNDLDIPTCLSPVDSLGESFADVEKKAEEEWRDQVLPGDKFVSESPVSTNCTGFCAESPTDALRPHVVRNHRILLACQLLKWVV